MITCRAIPAVRAAAPALVALILFVPAMLWADKMHHTRLEMVQRPEQELHAAERGEE